MCEKEDVQDWGVRYKYNHKHRGNQIIKSISKVFVSRKHVDQILLKKINNFINNNNNFNRVS